MFNAILLFSIASTAVSITTLVLVLYLIDMINKNTEVANENAEAFVYALKELAK